MPETILGARDTAEDKQMYLLFCNLIHNSNNEGRYKLLIFGKWKVYCPEWVKQEVSSKLERL